VKPANEIAQEAVLWLLVVLVLVWGLTGCRGARRLRLTKEELRLYEMPTFRQCLDPDVVCIVEGKR